MIDNRPGGNFEALSSFVVHRSFIIVEWRGVEWRGHGNDK
jgi:hypothetical protein